MSHIAIHYCPEIITDWQHSICKLSIFAQSYDVKLAQSLNVFIGFGCGGDWGKRFRVCGGDAGREREVLGVEWG
jgi:hypothetical protein